MANGLLLRLRERELSASPAERNVIAYVSAHPHEVVGLSVRGLADVTFSSPSSILRFCKRLGFAGYKEFQRELIAELALLGDKKDVALEDISMDDSVERIVGKVMKSNVRTIEATARTLDYTVLERCAARLKRARAVNLFGIGASRLVAHDLAQKLMRVDKDCHLYESFCFGHGCSTFIALIHFSFPPVTILFTRYNTFWLFYLFIHSRILSRIQAAVSSLLIIGSAVSSSFVISVI